MLFCRGAEKAYGKHVDYYPLLEFTLLLMEMQILKNHWSCLVYEMRLSGDVIIDG